MTVCSDDVKWTPESTSGVSFFNPNMMLDLDGKIMNTCILIRFRIKTYIFLYPPYWVSSKEGTHHRRLLFLCPNLDSALGT